MTRARLFAGAAALVYALSSMPALAKAGDYRFELVGKPQAKAGSDIVQVRLVQASDSKPVPDAVIFESPPWTQLRLPHGPGALTRSTIRPSLTATCITKTRTSSAPIR
jgi:hypothetical protein